MFKISKKITFPMGHRLSKHAGDCRYIHGHNFSVKIGVKSETLNENGMVMDFSELKRLAKIFTSEFDHSLTLNKKEDQEIGHFLTERGFKVNMIEAEPTAENMARALFKYLQKNIKEEGVEVDYVKVHENETSTATYTE